MIQSSKNTCFSSSTPVRGAHFDQRLVEEVYECLATQPDIETHDIHLQAISGTIMLEGSVTKPPMKAHIENLVAACPYVGKVINCLEVRDALSRAPKYFATHKEH